MLKPCLPTSLRLFVAAAVLAILLAPAAPARAAEAFTVPEIALPKDARHPVIACTAEELARLRAAWQSKGPEHAAVADEVKRADSALKSSLEFPPRGGQHNQWYQCDACQTALHTVDATHHQCPRCKKVYSGEPYDDVVFARVHGRNLGNMRAAAWAWVLTGRKEYAQYAAKVLLGYAERYEKYPYHSNNPRAAKPSASGGHLNEQTLGEASMMANSIAPAYDLIHDSGVLTAADHEAIRTGLIVPMLKNVAKYKAGKSNWQTWHNAAMLWGGAVLGDAAYVQAAVNDPKNGFLFQMTAGVTSDGMWYENSWGYHFYTLSAQTCIAEGARRLGVNLWRHPALVKMATIAPRYAMADGSLPRYGDDVRASASGGAEAVECAYNALKDPALAAQLPGRPTWESVMFGRAVAARERPPLAGSEVFLGAGHAILRTRGEPGLTAALTFGPYGGGHGHFDKLTFVFFGCGKELGVDPGRAASQAYRLPVHKNWYKATISHNGVLVDGAPQAPTAGKLLLFAANESYAAAMAACDSAYPGVQQKRLLAMTPTYLLVLDDLAAPKERRFDWLYHNRGTAATCPAADKDGAMPEPCPGREYVERVRTGVTGDPVAVTFAGPQVTTHLRVDAQAGTEVRTGDGVGASVSDRVPLACISRRGSAVRFAAVLEPVAKGRQPAVSAVAVEKGGAAGSVRITVQNGPTQDVFTVQGDSRITVTSGGKTVLSGP